MDWCESRFLPFWYGMGDHRAVVYKIPHYSILGEQVLKVVCPQAGRLQCGLTAEGSFDVHIWYNRVVNNNGSMLWQAFGVPLWVTICMLIAIQMMGYFLWTAHGESITTYDGQRDKWDPFQGNCQVNGAFPEGWVGVRSVMLWHQRAQGHEARVTNFISLSLLLLVALLYFGDGEIL